MRFEDKVVIVTGASSGIGEGVARKFLDEGALVVGCGIEPEMHIESSRAIYVQANLTEFAQAQHVVEEVVKAFGRVNKLVCCAGVTFVGLKLGNSCLAHIDTPPMLMESSLIKVS